MNLVIDNYWFNCEGANDVLLGEMTFLTCGDNWALTIDICVNRTSNVGGGDALQLLNLQVLQLGLLDFLHDFAPKALWEKK